MLERNLEDSNSKLYSFLLNFDLFFRGQLCSSWKEETGIWEKSSYNAHINVILCTFYKLLSQKMLHLRIYVKKMTHLRTFVEKRILNLVPNGTKVSIWSQKVQILLASPKFFRFPHFFSTFPGFLGFYQFFSVVFRFSKVLHKSSRLHRGTNMTRNSGLEKVPILLTSPKFLSFPRFFFRFSQFFSVVFSFSLRLSKALH